MVCDVEPEEFFAVLEAAKTNPEVAEKVIVGFLAVLFINEIRMDVGKAIYEAVPKTTKEALRKATKEAFEKAIEETLKKTAKNTNVN